jgi:hypothetical protein
MYEIEIEQTYPNGTASKTRVRVRSWVELQSVWDRLVPDLGALSPFDSDAPLSEAAPKLMPVPIKTGPVSSGVGPDILKDMRNKFADDALAQNYFETDDDWNRAEDALAHVAPEFLGRFKVDRALVLAIARPLAYGKKTASMLVRSKTTQEVLLDGQRHAENPNSIDVNYDMIAEPHDGQSMTDPDAQVFTFTAVELLGLKAAENPPVEAMSR